MRARAVDTIEVEGPPDRAIVALGDSITEGYVSSDVGRYQGHHDDYRNAWSSVAQTILRIPVVNAAVSAYGIEDTIRYLGAEVLTLQGITDCAVLIGTNDLHAHTPEQLEARLAHLLTQLRPFCRLWMGTLLPKEIADPNFQTIAARRLAVNEWIRQQAQVAGVIDFGVALARSDDPHRFRPGLGEDGIHPSIAGQRVMGEQAGRVMSPPRLVSLSPESATTAGGNSAELRGENFKTGATVSLGGLAGSDVVVSSPSSLTFKTPPHAPGIVDVSVTNPDGLSSVLRGAFTYLDAGPGTQPQPSPTSNLADPARRSGCDASNGRWATDSLLWASLLWTLATRHRRRTQDKGGSKDLD